MKKKLCAALLAGSLLLPLSGCSAKDTEKRTGYNVEVEELQIFSATDALRICTYNGYQISDYEIIEDNGGYIIAISIGTTARNRK